MLTRNVDIFRMRTLELTEMNLVPCTIAMWLPVSPRAAILVTPSSYVDEGCYSPQMISSSC